MNSLKRKFLIAKTITYIFWLDKKHGRSTHVVQPFEYHGNIYFNLLGRNNETFKQLIDTPEFESYLNEFEREFAFSLCDDPEMVDFYYSGEFLEDAEFIRLGTLLDILVSGERAILFTINKANHLCTITANEDFEMADVVRGFYNAYTSEHGTPDETPCYKYERKLIHHLSKYWKADNHDWLSLPMDEKAEEMERVLTFRMEGFRFKLFGYQ